MSKFDQISTALQNLKIINTIPIARSSITSIQNPEQFRSVPRQEHLEPTTHESVLLKFAEHLKFANYFSTKITTPTRLVPNAFSHSGWTPFTDTLRFCRKVTRLLLPESTMPKAPFGSVTAIRSAAGGDITASPVIKSQFTYTGREWDAESGLYYYRARTYDPALGRFLQQDPDAGDIRSPGTIINKFSYVENRATMRTDPSGRFSIGGFLNSIGLNNYRVAEFIVGATYDIIRANVPDEWRTRLDTTTVVGSIVVAALIVAPGTASAALVVTAFQNRNNNGGNFFDKLDSYGADFTVNFGVAYATGIAVKTPAPVADQIGQGIALKYLGENLCKVDNNIPSGVGHDIASFLLISDRAKESCR